ncbi:MAG TPA: M3 family metallopeptidase [Bacilli bacterium]|nr:M3 family metallopeptidase [Bacilli bacterium]
MGLERLAEADLLAPLTYDARSEAADGSAVEGISYEAALTMIAEEFGRFSPAMAAFVREAVEKRWIEAEAREDKSLITYCTYLPVSKQPRVFTTFTGRFQDVQMLAHELGHAYHFQQVSEQSALAHRVPMSLVEIPSTFADTVFSKGYLARLEDGEGAKAAKTALLNERVNQMILYVWRPFMQFLFERQAVEACRRGEALSATRLDELMIEVQKRVYGERLAAYTPVYWISNNLYYLTDRTYFNYPYTFGYLFSAGLYAVAMEQGELSPEQYDALLQDMGRMSVEDLARKHLGADVTEEAFWQQAFDLLYADVEAFLAVTEARRRK